MKKMLVCLLALALMIPCASSLAEDAQGETPFVVGCTTTLSGAFFTNMWGNNTSDIDVRTLIHGYSPVVWTMQTLFEIDTAVVRELTVAELEDGNKLFVIDLQEDLTYNDGTPITAADYAFSMLLHGSPVIEALGGIITNVRHVAGYDAYRQGERDVFSGIRLLGKYRYSVEVDARYLPFFYELSMIDCIPYPIGVIAPGCEVADDGQGAYIRNADASAQAPRFTPEHLETTIFHPDTGYLSNPKVTSGPYQLEAYDPVLREASFRINPRYKGNYEGQKPSIAHLRLVNVVPDTMMEQLYAREVHLLNKCVAEKTIQDGLELEGQGLASSENYPRMGFGFLSFACEQGPTQFEAVRQAIAYAVDVESFCQLYTSLNYGIPVYGYYGIGQWMVQMIQYPSYRHQEGEQDAAAWDALTLDALNRYQPNLEQAKALLTADGWTLNSQGNPFVDGADTLRYKEVDGALMPLSLRYAKMENSIAAQLLDVMLEVPLAELGMALETIEMPFTEVLDQYYRHTERVVDMMYLATNFISVFDPYFVFNTNEDFAGTQNTTGYRDEKLEQLALDMRKTESGDLLTYCQRWMAFQQYWNEKLPMLPLYSNVYFDFFVPELVNYHPDNEMNWPVAILYAELNES